MTSSAETAVVGTYVTEGEAQDARERLTEVGIAPVSIAQLSRDAWQVKVASRHREQALQEVQRMEKRNIADL